MSAANSIIGAILGAALSRLSGMPLVGLALLSAVAAVVMLLIIKATSNQARLAVVKRSIHACIYEVRLFSSDAPAVFRAMGELLRHQLTYLRLSLVPLFVMVLPFGLLLAHLDAYYGVADLPPGRATLVKVRMKDSTGPPRLVVPNGVSVETPAVWIPSLREAAWRISTTAPGDYELSIATGDAVVTKRLTTTAGIVRRSPVRPCARILDQLWHPAESPVPRESAVESVSVIYPSRSIDVLGWNFHWLLVFFVLTMGFALALKSTLRVVV
ncbi:MAG TPA: hypothetical protein VN700_01100 [Vicinamibacterales bacterium]|nr:hypothetical protein [Vicinamibacterales bacterium]